MTLQEAKEFFRSLGATKFGKFLNKKRNPRTGETTFEEFHDLVYFFSPEDEEIGYWSSVSEALNNPPTTFEPNERRVWPEEARASLRIYDL